MPVTPIDAWLEWLEHIEEELGLYGAVYGTIDPEACRKLLYEELGYEPSQAQIDLMFETGRTKYEGYPQIGVRSETVTYHRGTIGQYKELWFRDIPTGRRISTVAVAIRLADIGFY